MLKINILQLGEIDYSYKCKNNEHIVYFYEPNLIGKPKENYDICFIGRNINKNEKEYLFKYIKAYCLFYFDNFMPDKTTSWIIKSRKGRKLKVDDFDRFIQEKALLFFPKQYGEKMKIEYLNVSDSFKGKILYDGYQGVSLDGNFGENFRQIAYWSYNLPFEDNIIDLWVEYEKDPSINLELHIVKFQVGSISTIVDEIFFSEKEMKNIVSIESNRGDSFFISLKAKGKGHLKIVSIHDRFSHKEFGCCLNGGQRFVTSKREEVFFYFDPGDMKPPLNVYFSGFKTVEGFEAYNLMRRLKAPFLLISESRLLGGSFYIGDQEYEQLIVDKIKDYLQELHFSNNQLVLSGLSMGTYAALYYGCDLLPYAINIGKPLINLGNIALNERINRANGFPTSIDILRKMTGASDLKAVETLNNRLWDKIKNTNWNNNKIIIAYQYEDDYDATAYKEIINCLMDKKVDIIGKGLHGRHNDNTFGIVEWYEEQYKILVQNDFERESNGGEEDE